MHLILRSRAQHGVSKDGPRCCGRAALNAAGVKPIDGQFLDFRDPWGNRIEIVGYDNVQFTKAPNVLRGMGLTQLTKNESAKKELAEKGMAAS
jgi:lactoylglutathione lyase